MVMVGRLSDTESDERPYNMLHEIIAYNVTLHQKNGLLMFPPMPAEPQQCVGIEHHTARIFQHPKAAMSVIS